jgi:hypothetical protein
LKATKLTTLLSPPEGTRHPQKMSGAFFFIALASLLPWFEKNSLASDSGDAGTISNLYMCGSRSDLHSKGDPLLSRAPSCT